MNSGQVPAGSIVVGIDGSPWSETALTWAIDQAALEQRTLTIVHSVEPIAFPGSGGMYATTGVDYGRLLDDAQEAARTLMAGAAAQAISEHPRLSVHQVLNHDDPRRTLLGLGQRAAMIVVGSRGRGPIASLLLGSVSVSVSKHAACPVVVHRPSPAERPQLGVLLGVDGAADSGPAIDFAFRMASWRALPLTVLHCSWDVAPVASVQTRDSLPFDTNERALVAESLAGMQEKFPDVRVHVRFAHGFADEHLITDSPSYELVVVGHHPIPLLNDIIYGSVAPAVVEQAVGAVAVVPSP